MSSAVEKTWLFLAGIVVLRSSVAIDDAGEHATQRLDAERQRRDVEQQHVLDVALQHAGLDGGADGHDLVGIDALVRVLAEEGLDDLLHLGHARHAADQHHLVDLLGFDPGILERRHARPDRALHQVVDEGLELRTRELDVEVLGPVLIGRDERQVDVRLLRRGQLDLRLLRRLAQALQRQPVVAQVDALLFLELVGDVIHDSFVKVLAAKEGVAVGRLDLEDAVADVEDRDVERATAEIVDGDLAGLLLVETIGQSRRRRLVDDAQDF